MSNDLLFQLQQATTETQKAWAITQVLLRSMPNELGEAVLAASIPHWFNTPILAGILQIEPDRATVIFAQLQTLPFVARFGALGFALHDLTRDGILRHLITDQLDHFIMYSQLAHDYFSQFEDEQARVEAIYHLLAIDKTSGMSELKKQMKLYRDQARSSAANNLIRNAQELVDLNILTDKEAVEIERQYYLVGWNLARLGLQEIAWDKAQEYLTEAIKLFGSDDDPEQYKTLDPQQLRDRVTNSQRRYLMQKVEEAKQQNQSLRQKVWLNELAENLREADEYELAMQRYEEALALDPNDTNALSHRGEIYRLIENYEAALADFDRAIELDEKNAWAISLRGETYRLMKNYKAALADFDRAIELDEKNDWTISLRGETYRLMKNYEAALADFDRAIELDQKNAWAISHRGETYWLMKNYEAALVDFDRAIELDEKDTWAISHRGETYRMMRNYEAALVDFDRAIELDEKGAWVISCRGETYRMMRNYEAALADFDRAIELNEKGAWAISHRGETYRMMKNYEAALADFDRAIELNEKGAWAISHRGETYRLMKNYEAALADFDRAIELDGKYEWALSRRGKTYRLIKN